jgi:hypothetical protein
MLRIAPIFRAEHSLPIRSSKPFILVKEIADASQKKSIAIVFASKTPRFLLDFAPFLP